MISALIGWGIGFGGVNFIPTHGLGAGPPVAVALTPEVKLRTLAAADAALSAYLGASPFRWFDTQIPQRLIGSGACVRVRRLDTAQLQEVAGINPLDSVSFQADVLDTDPQRARDVAEAIADFLGTADLSTDLLFDSPPGQPAHFPCFVVNQRAGVIPQTSPQVYIESIQFTVWNKENFT